MHLAKGGFDEYFLHKVRRGESGPFHERFLLKQRDIEKLKEPT